MEVIKNKITMFLDTAKLISVPIEDCLIIEVSMSKIKNAYSAGCVDSANKKEVYEKLLDVKK